jgi:hypothetical protein
MARSQQMLCAVTQLIFCSLADGFVISEQVTLEPSQHALIINSVCSKDKGKLYVVHSVHC